MQKMPVMYDLKSWRNSFEARTLSLVRKHCLSVTINPDTGKKTFLVRFIFDPERLTQVAPGYNQALTRLNSLAKKLTKAGPVEKELIDLINGSISSGLWEEVSEKELEDSNES